MIKRRDDFRNDRSQENRNPAFQLNKFQSEFNLSFNKEMAKVLANALNTNEEIVQNNGKNVPTCLYALLSKLEDMQKPRNYDDRNNYEDNDYDYDSNNSHSHSDEKVCEYR